MGVLTKTGLGWFIVVCVAAAEEPANLPETAGLAEQLAQGDIILHRSRSQQSRALRLATQSPWTHVGMVFKDEDGWRVLEAVQPVRWTSLSQWVARGQNREVVTLRYDGEFDATALQAAGESYLGRPYDVLFQWGDDRIYCSELVYKAWEQIGIELGQQKPMGAFDLNSVEVQTLIAARTTNGIDPHELVVAPSSFLEDEKLRVIVGKP